MRRSGPLAAVSLALFLVGCEARVTVDTSSVLFDSQVFKIDHGAPTTRFDGAGSSVLLGSGWSRPSAVREGSQRRYRVWVTGVEAELSFPAGRAALDFYADVRPFHYQGAPEQSLTLFLNDAEVGTRVLPPGRQRVRMPLPAAAARTGHNRLVLRLAHAAIPKEVMESEDTRELSALFETLAIVPSTVDDVPAFLASHRVDADDRTIALPVGGAASLLLPPSASAVLALDSATTEECPECELVVELETPEAGIDEVWRGTADRASGLEIEVSTEATGAHRLIARVEPPSDVPGWTAGSFALTLAPVALTQQRAGKTDEAPTHVFVYMIDTLRADALEPYGSRRPTSPRIARFADQSVVYENAWTPSSWTLPATVSLLTGVYPDRHGVMQGDVKLSEEGPLTIQQFLAERGFASLGISQSFVAGPDFGLDTGFGTFVLSNRLGSGALRSQEVRAHFLSWAVERWDFRQPLFAYLHTVDPHAPYEPQGPGRVFLAALTGEDTVATTAGGELLQRVPNDAAEAARRRALYDGEVLFADEQFGRFIEMLEHLDLYDQSLVILVSDHGEEFGEHGAYDHGRTVFEEMLRVPLVVKYPFSELSGLRVEERVSTLDVVPTILDVLGLDPGDLAPEGRSLAGEMPRDRARDRELVYTEVNPSAGAGLAEVDLAALARGPLKCVANALGRDQFGLPAPAYLTFDLSTDPLELSPLATDDSRSRSCRRALEAWKETRAERGGELPDERTASEAREVLRALGYLD